MTTNPTGRACLDVTVRGAVQGVGFRPFVYRLARERKLAGSVINDSDGVRIEAEGDRARLEDFLQCLERERPSPAVIEAVHATWSAPRGLQGFRIEASVARGTPTAQVLPDIATCSACLSEVRDTANRRHGYPFTNCTFCGPRFTVIRSLPYDRRRTTMQCFEMCDACRAEYTSPADRRFHAQPNACPVCGPRLELRAADGSVLHGADGTLSAVVDALSRGRIVAVKGLGGFHLMVDAADESSVARLRERKPRRAKPLALMVRDLEQAAALCEIDTAGREALASPEAPIVLLRRHADAPVAGAVAPDNPYLGIMLPSTPLHHLLMDRVAGPLVATSGNLSDEPICIDEDEALQRLAGVADLFLVHDRPIARHVDDSIVWLAAGELRLLRRARGYAPRPVRLAAPVPTVLAVGGHLKNTVALSVGDQVFLSQHIGDMETPEALTAFERVIDDFLSLYETEPVAVAHDLHPDYVTTHRARARAAARGLPLLAVQHHHAHLAACLAESHHESRALGVCWDGTGYGSDGTIWGGEFLLGDAASFRRVASLRPFRLPGGDAAVRQPRRAALALCWELDGAAALARDLAPQRSFDDSERRLLGRMLQTGLRAPVTTSAGRLFDGLAALLGLRQESRFEGEAAMALEFVCDENVSDAYDVPMVDESGIARLDWRPLVAAAVDDHVRGVATGVIAARIHGALAAAIVRVARHVGEPCVALSGGCFQNRVLVERTVAGLRAAGFEVLLHRHVPPNDGGISLGQIAVAAAQLERTGATAARDAATLPVMAYAPGRKEKI